MAVTQNPLIGKARGKMANAVFTTWKGQNVLKSKALNPYNPNTPAQQAQRNAFKFVVDSLSLISAMYLLLFKKLALKSSEFNIAVKKFLLWYDSHTLTYSTSLAQANPLVSVKSIPGFSLNTLEINVNGYNADFDAAANISIDGQTANAIAFYFDTVTNKFIELGVKSSQIDANLPATFEFTHTFTLADNILIVTVIQVQDSNDFIFFDVRELTVVA